MIPTPKKQESWEEVYARFHGKVSGYIHGRISNPGDAEDLISDVFVKIFENLDRFDLEKASMSTWIYTITRNTLTDWFRTRRVDDRLPEQPDAQKLLSSVETPEDAVINEEMLEQLASGLEKLALRERDLIILHYYSGQTLKEIADRMDLSYSMVKVIHKSTLEHLRKHFKR